LPIAVASTFSPSGMVAAGKHGLGVLSLGGAVGRMILNLNEQWQIGEQTAAQHGQTMDRAQWRIVLPFYLAEDRDEAINDVRQGFYDFQHNYVGAVLGRPPQDGQDDIALLARRDQALVGTPDDAIRILTNLQQQTGGFGGFTGLFHAWAPEHKLQRSYELLARYVMPHFQGQIDPLRDAERWAIDNRDALFGQIPAAISQAFADAGKPLPDPQDTATDND
jgi:limonene 1,2-monooxygenase